MSKIEKDDIDKWYDYGIDVKTSTLYMGSETTDDEGESGVDSAMAEKVIKGLHLLDRHTSNGITIKMNNLGGDFIHGLAIYDAIRACKNHITIIVYGNVMSMGTVILQAADKRILMPNAQFMIHYGTDGYYGHAKDFQRAAAYSKKLNDWMIDLYLKKIREKYPKSRKYTRKFVEDTLNFDTFLWAKEVVDLGLADEIWTEESSA
ncbi:MAG: ATP-dependent Clp protease proteolytic subunit [Leptolyngbyaceae cyanobacterium RM2_2_4]|nr:ATP-dependent Clp protease proteolytic subunit [Leptolyngbyaceae cyanobacterium RM2_2_4]